MDREVMSFTKIKVNYNLLDEIWEFDPRGLDQVDGSKLSSYAIALAQYLIYFNYQKNKAKAEVHRLTKYIDRTISLTLSANSTLLKQYKTKVAATDYIISTNVSLTEAQTNLDIVQLELMNISGIDKSISELIATIKRELTRRENELYSVRMERK